MIQTYLGGSPGDGLRLMARDLGGLVLLLGARLLGSMLTRTSVAGRLLLAVVVLVRRMMRVIMTGRLILIVVWMLRVRIGPVQTKLFLF